MKRKMKTKNSLRRKFLQIQTFCFYYRTYIVFVVFCECSIPFCCTFVSTINSVLCILPMLWPVLMWTISCNVILTAYLWNYSCCIFYMLFFECEIKQIQPNHNNAYQTANFHSKTHSYDLFRIKYSQNVYFFYCWRRRNNVKKEHTQEKINPGEINSKKTFGYM